ncbi:MAG: acetate--CoA ligase family protein [Rhizobiaceae bacterium]
MHGLPHHSTDDRRAALDPIFKPSSVALIGISGDPAKLTGAPLRLLVQGGFQGTVYPVNPRYEEMAGLRCYPSVSALPEAPDVAIIMLPAKDVPNVVRDCGRKGVRAVVVFSSGFEESDGGQLADALRAAAAEYGLPLIGPNCEGVWSVGEKAFLTFGSAANRPIFHHAPVAIISQSGAVAGGVSRQLQDSGLGCAYMVSVGNETCIDTLDVLEWMIGRDDVKVVALFIEGLRNARRLVCLAAEARSRGIQIVALKSGNSRIGRLAVASHTGKVASPHAIYRDVFSQAGIVQVDGITELIDAVGVLTTLPHPKRRADEDAGVAVFSVPGGTRALTADHCERQDIPMARFAPATEAELRQILPGFAQVGNPTDLTGQVLSSPELFDRSLTVVAGDPNCGALVIQFGNRGPHDLEKKLDLISAVARERRIPVVVSMLGDRLPQARKVEMLRKGIAVAEDPAEAVRILTWLYRAAEHLELAAPPAIASDAASARPVGWAEMTAMLARVGIRSAPEATNRTETQLEADLASLSFPLVIKAFPDQAEHKTELGLVEIGIGSLDEARSSMRRIRALLGDDAAPLLVQEMISGVEVVLSVVTDPDFGPILGIGSGGVGVELWDDIGFLSLPVDDDAIRRTIARLRLGTLLDGFRGKPKADIDALVGAARRLGDFVAAPGVEIGEVEINPLFVGPRGAGVVAADILVKGPQEHPSLGRTGQQTLRPIRQRV